MKKRRSVTFENSHNVCVLILCSCVHKFSRSKTVIAPTRKNVRLGKIIINPKFKHFKKSNKKKQIHQIL